MVFWIESKGKFPGLSNQLKMILPCSRFRFSSIEIILIIRVNHSEEKESLYVPVFKSRNVKLVLLLNPFTIRVVKLLSASKVRVVWICDYSLSMQFLCAIVFRYVNNPFMLSLFVLRKLRGRVIKVDRQLRYISLCKVTPCRAHY